MILYPRSVAGVTHKEGVGDCYGPTLTPPLDFIHWVLETLTSMPFRLFSQLSPLSCPPLHRRILLVRNMKLLLKYPSFDLHRCHGS